MNPSKLLQVGVLNFENEVKILLQERVEEAYAALHLYDKHEDKTRWAKASVNYAEALCNLADSEIEPQAFMNYQKAITAFEDALTVYRKANHFPVWVNVQLKLVKTLRQYASRLSGGQQAIALLHHAQKTVSQIYSALYKEKNFIDCGLLKIEEGHLWQTFTQIDYHGDKAFHLHQAAKAFANAIKLLRQSEQFFAWANALTFYGFIQAERALNAKQAQAEKLLMLARNSLESAKKYFSSEQQYTKELYLVSLELARIYAQQAPYSSKIKQKALLLDAKNLLESLEEQEEEFEEDTPSKLHFQDILAQILSSLASLDNVSEKLRLRYLERSTLLRQRSLALWTQQPDAKSLSLLIESLTENLLDQAKIFNLKDFYFSEHFIKQPVFAKNFLTVPDEHDKPETNSLQFSMNQTINPYLVVLATLGANIKLFFQQEGAGSFEQKLYENSLNFYQNFSQFESHDGVISKRLSPPREEQIFKHFASLFKSLSLGNVPKRARLYFLRQAQKYLTLADALAIAPATPEAHFLQKLEEVHLAVLLAFHETDSHKRAIFKEAKSKAEASIALAHKNNNAYYQAEAILQLLTVLSYGAAWQKNPRLWLKQAEQKTEQLLIRVEQIQELSQALKIKNKLASFLLSQSETRSAQEGEVLLQKSVLLFTDIINFSQKKEHTEEAQQQRDIALHKLDILRKRAAKQC